MNRPTDHQSDDRPLEQRSHALFNEQVMNLDARTRSRLNQARQATLAAARGESPLSGARWWLPAGCAVALSLAGLFSMRFIRSVDQAPMEDMPMMLAGVVADVELLASGDELELLQNVDFYAWLETQPEGLRDGTEGETG